VADEQSGQPIGPTSVTIDEMETAGSPKADSTAVKLEGDNIPESLRGKSVADLLEAQTRLEAALRVSESAREQQQLLIRQAGSQPAVEPTPLPTIPEEKELTREEFAVMYEERPLDAIEKMQEQQLKRAQRIMEQRLAPLTAGTSSIAEQAARQKFGEEFEILGNEIEGVIKKISGGRASLSTVDAWQDVVSYVRGQPGNFEKIIEKRATKVQARSADDARQEQINAAGFNGISSIRAPAPTRSGKELDSIEKQIAAELGLTEDEYKRWR
jgi:hypothetical protein